MFLNASKCSIFLKSLGDCKTITWSGGTSTELFIYPPHADFAQRAFDFRLSIATVEIEESTFSVFPNTHRVLLLLEGAFTLTHAGYHQSTLKPFEQDQFEGDWETHCKGTGKDFNLLYKSPLIGSIEVIADQILSLTSLHTLLFAVNNGSKVDQTTMQKDDFMVIQNLNRIKNEQIKLKGQFIIVKIDNQSNPIK